MVLRLLNRMILTSITLCTVTAAHGTTFVEKWNGSTWVLQSTHVADLSTIINISHAGSGPYRVRNDNANNDMGRINLTPSNPNNPITVIVVGTSGQIYPDESYIPPEAGIHGQDLLLPESMSGFKHLLAVIL